MSILNTKLDTNSKIELILDYGIDYLDPGELNQSYVLLKNEADRLIRRIKKSMQISNACI